MKVVLEKRHKSHLSSRPRVPEFLQLPADRPLLWPLAGAAEPKPRGPRPFSLKVRATGLPRYGDGSPPRAPWMGPGIESTPLWSKGKRRWLEHPVVTSEAPKCAPLPALPRGPPACALPCYPGAVSGCPGWGSACQEFRHRPGTTPFVDLKGRRQEYCPGAQGRGEEGEFSQHFGWPRTVIGRRRKC